MCVCVPLSVVQGVDGFSITIDRISSKSDWLEPNEKLKHRDVTHKMDTHPSHSPKTDTRFRGVRLTDRKNVRKNEPRLRGLQGNQRKSFLVEVQDLTVGLLLHHFSPTLHSLNRTFQTACLCAVQQDRSTTSLT